MRQRVQRILLSRASRAAVDGLLVLALLPSWAWSDQLGQRSTSPSDRGRRAVDRETGEYVREPTARDDLDQRLPVAFMPAAAEPEALVERPAPAPAAGHVLFDNGSLVDCDACGAGGAGESQLRDLTGDRETLGFGHQVSAGGRIADDFRVDAPDGWTVRDIRFFAYQTGSSTRSTITAVNLKIWSGPPGAPGSEVLWDGGEAHRLTESRWSGVYRVSESSAGATNRPIMENTVAVNTTLEPGSYWLDWQTDGRLASGPWAPSLAREGNALQSLDGGASWEPAVDPGTGEGAEFPFVIEGDFGLAGTGPAVNLLTTLTTTGRCNVRDTATVPPGSEVEYCYLASNTGDRTLSLHNLVDDELGHLLSDLSFDLSPGDYYWFDTTETVLATTTNTAVWSSFTGPSEIVSDDDSATVFVSTGRSLQCNNNPVLFTNGIPSDWTVVNNAPGNPVVWTDLIGCGEAGNYTQPGAPDGVACASSDYQGTQGSLGAGTGLYDTELRSPPFSLIGVESAFLSYWANYQNLASDDFLNVDISEDNGSTWTTLVSWNEDHGEFRGTLGESGWVSLDSYTGRPHLIVRWRYFDPVGPTLGDDDWYAQINRISLGCSLPVGGFYECSEPAATIPDFPSPGVFDAITLESSIGTIHDLDVRLRVSHDYVGDLKGILTLKQLAGWSIVNLFDRPGLPPAGGIGGCSENDIHVVVDDEGSDGMFETTCLPSQPTILGSVVGGDPPNPAALSFFDGFNAGGDWELNVFDNSTGVTGTLDEWCLIGTSCGRSIENQILSGTTIVEDCGTLSVGPNVWIQIIGGGGTSLRAATGVVFNNGVMVEGDLEVEIDPSLALP